MANKEIHYMSDNGTMFWPATTTTAIIDPTSREVLDVILEKKEDKPIEITECIPSRIMSINSAEDAVTLTSEEETQLAPLITGFTTTGTKFTFGTLPAVPTDYTNTYSWEIWGMAGITARFLIALKLHYIDEEVSGDTIRSYWVESDYREVLFTDSTTSGDEPTFLNIDLADLESEEVSAFRTEYYPGPEDDPLSSTIFEGTDGKYKDVILRIRVLEDDNPEEINYSNIDEDYWNFSLRLVHLTPETTDSAWNNFDAYYFGSYTYEGFSYSAIVNKTYSGDYTLAIIKINLGVLGTITSLPAYEDVPIYPTAGDNINTAFGKINRIIQSHEEVTARALLDLNSRIQSASGGGGGGIQEITWSALKTLRDGENLTPGQLYRINDYTCTTTQTDTQSAGHVFDIIVLALSGSVLSEEAWAIQHSGDTYFANSNLAAWKLKYCLDNNTDRFTWADITNGKGVIYWMKDEWENECPYDFKNIQFKRYQLSSLSSWSYNGTITEETFRFSPTNPYYYKTSSEIAGGAPYRSQAGDFSYFYTFNGIEITNALTAANESEYIFENYDMSFQKTRGTYTEVCKFNKIKSNSIYLPNTVFFGYPNGEGNEDGVYSIQFITNVVGNEISLGCTNLTFGPNAQDNHINCFSSDIVFGKECWQNEVGQSCYIVVLGNKCGRNVIDDNGSYINISGQGTDDSNETYIEQCIDNYIENSGMEIYLSGSNNTIHSSCQKLVMYGESYNNTIESNFNVGTIYNSSHCYIGKSCDHIYFGKSSFITIKNDCSNINFPKAYMFNIEVGACNYYISITTSQTPTSSNLLQNLIIKPGVNMSSTIKNISHDTLGDTILTTYKPANSVEISV